MKKIEKKAWPVYFNKVASGEKKYDFRLADWDCRVGDILVLREWDPKTAKYTGRIVEKKITYKSVFKINKLSWSREEIEKYGFLIVSLE